jgi:signal transduction histidine kinase
MGVRAGERRRLARELHDTVAHALGVALNSLELHEAYLERDPSRAARELRTARTAVRGALEHIRALSADLRGPEVHGDLEPALGDYLAQVAPAATAWSVTVSGDDRALAAGTRDELFLILREAARNALIHATARHLDIAVAIGADTVDATVTDDGHGFDPRGHAETGGIASMRERAESLGGAMTLSSAPGAGTIVQVHVPVDSGEIGPDQP